MSEDNVCNFCKLKQLRAGAKAQGRYVRIRRSTGKLKGTNVYVVPDASQFYHLEEGHHDHDTYFRTWFMSIPDHCVC